MKKAHVQAQAAVSLCFSCSQTSGATRFSRTQLQRPPHLRRCNVCVAQAKARVISTPGVSMPQLESLDYSTCDPRLWERAAIGSWVARVLSQPITDEERRWIDDVTPAATPLTPTTTPLTPTATPPIPR